MRNRTHNAEITPMHHDKLKDFTSETARKAGRKSKRRSLDAILQEKALKLLNSKVKKGESKTKMDLMVEVAYTYFLKGNDRPLRYLVDRGFGKAKDSIQVEMTGPDGQQLQNNVKIEFIEKK